MNFKEFNTKLDTLICDALNNDTSLNDIEKGLQLSLTTIQYLRRYWI